MKKSTWIIVAILIVLAISLALIFTFMKSAPQKTSAEKCFEDFNASLVKANSTLLYPDFVRDCCAKPVSQQASCLDQYGLLD